MLRGLRLGMSSKYKEINRAFLKIDPLGSVYHGRFDCRHSSKSRSHLNLPSPQRCKSRRVDNMAKWLSSLEATVRGVLKRVGSAKFPTEYRTLIISLPCCLCNLEVCNAHGKKYLPDGSASVSRRRLYRRKDWLYMTNGHMRPSTFTLPTLPVCVF
jgi:hypothetical protein